MSEPPAANYDEAKVPQYELPPLMKTIGGAKIETPDDWRRRRTELLKLFSGHVYGQAPTAAVEMKAEVQDVDETAIAGRATRKQVALHLERGGRRATLNLLLYLPNDSNGSVATFCGLNFSGNHAVDTDAGIALADLWNRDKDEPLTLQPAREEDRGVRADRWCVDLLLRRGYGLATVYYGDIFPDHPEGFAHGVWPLFYDARKPGERTPDQAGAIGCWAWGLSRIADYLQAETSVDSARVSVIGHSRLGKTALWAGAQDQRFAMVVSNNSGCGGAAISRRCFGETVARINAHFPHWFCERFKQYNQREGDLPVDQHMLLALAAPRPLCVASATEDLWADPRGEFLAVRAASPAWELFGGKGLDDEEMPPPGRQAGRHLGYHIRTGKHGITLQDWSMYLDFADRYLRTM